MYSQEEIASNLQQHLEKQIPLDYDNPLDPPKEDGEQMGEGHILTVSYKL